MKMLISKPTCQIFILNFDDYIKKVANLNLRNHIISNLDVLVVWRFKALDPLRNGMV